MARKKIGLLIGDENDWPTTLQGLSNYYAKGIGWQENNYQLDYERIRIEPFPLTANIAYDVVIDRLAYWHLNPREWLKKAALLNQTYLLNNPFTFQSMEKHSAYCAMLRLGLHIPETWLIPQKHPPAGFEDKFLTTAGRYHDLFSLPDIAQQIGYPLFMKPFDGGGWRGVSMIDREETLMRAYDESSHTLMHLQKGLDNYEVFVRCLGIGPQIGTFHYDPSQPLHGRYIVDHQFLNEEQGWEVQTITKIINSFFRWDFNSCEMILKDNTMWPIDFANACPDIALTSLHYYYPWAIKSLFAWSAFCAVTDRPVHITMNIQPYFEIADSDRSYREKLEAYSHLADDHLEAEAFEEFKRLTLANLDEVMWHFAQTPDFDHTIVETVQTTFPNHEHDRFIAHYRGLINHWVEAESAKF